MTEETKIPTKEEILAAANAGVEVPEKGNEAEAEDNEYSEIEQQAMEAGWNPEGVEGKPFLSAEEFIGRQPLYDDIRSLKKQLRKTQDGVEAMKKMQADIRAREREKVIAELTAAKRDAYEEGDFDAVMKIDDQIASEKANKNEPAENLAFEAWVDNNEWYHQDQEMRKYADLIGTGYVAQNEGVDPSKVFEYVEKEVKARFADKFENPARSKPTMAEGATRGRRAASKGARHKVSDLPEDARGIMRTIVRSGAMTEAEYLKEYFGE